MLWSHTPTTLLLIMWSCKTQRSMGSLNCIKLVVGREVEIWILICLLLAGLRACQLRVLTRRGMLIGMGSTWQRECTRLYLICSFDMDICGRHSVFFLVEQMKGTDRESSTVLCRKWRGLMKKILFWSLILGQRIAILFLENLLNCAQLVEGLQL